MCFIDTIIKILIQNTLLISIKIELIWENGK
jgi:hypothetical protein